MAIPVAVLGLGSRGAEWVRHVRAAPGFELTACIEADAAVLAREAARLRLPADRCFSSLAAACERRPSRAVIVATPPDHHHAATAAVLARRMAVLVEKPFTMRLADAQHLVSGADAAGVPLLVAQNYRYLRVFRAVRGLVARGALGRVRLVTGHYYRVPHAMAASLARLPHAVLWGMAVHHLDVLRHVLGQEATGVSAESFETMTPAAGAGAAPAGASFRALLTFAQGTRAVYTASYESSGHQFFEQGQEFYGRLVGDRATLHVIHRWLVLCENRRLPRLVRRGPRTEPEEQNLLRQLRRAIESGEPAEVSGRDNLQTMAIVEACLRSAGERRWVNPQDLL